MQVIKKKPTTKNINEPTTLVTTLENGDSISMNGPAQVTLVSAKHDGHEGVVRISVKAPLSTKIQKEKK